MKLLVIGDLHLGARNGNAAVQKMMSNFFQNELFPYIKQNKIKDVICLGDLLDRRKSIEFTVANFMNSFLNFFRENKVNFYNIVGNHDTVYRNTTSLIGLKEIISESEKYVHIISEPTEINFDNTCFDLIPWVCDDNHDGIVKFLKENISDEKIVCGHFELSGFRMQGNTYSETGTLEVADLQKYKYVLSGHYHSPSTRNNIIYVGTPYQITWNDADDHKRFFVYDTTTKQLEEIPTFIRLFKKIVLNEKSDAEKIKTIIENTDNDTFIRIINNSGSKVSDKILTNLNEKVNILGVDYIENNSEEDNTKSEELEKIICDPLQILLTTIDNDEEKSTEDKKIIKQMAYELYKAAESAEV